MYTAKINTLHKIYSQADNGDVFELRIDIFEDSLELQENGDLPEPIETRSFSYPLTTTEDEMKEEVQKFIENYNAEKKLAAANEESDKIHAEADKVIENLTGAEFTSHNDEEDEE